MPAYIHGSLAVKEQVKEAPKRAQKQQPAKKVKPSIPMGEKMLYIVSMILCAGIAGAILWQSAQIYSINTNMQKVQYEIKKLEKENGLLQIDAQGLQEPKRLLEKAKALGFVQTSEETAIPVSPNKDIVMAGEKKVAYLE